MKKALCVLLCFSAPAMVAGQAAAPQARTPWADSTHVTGTAVRVMPDIPVATTAPETVKPPVPAAPATIQELLQRWEGNVFYVPSRLSYLHGDLPGYHRLRVAGGSVAIERMEWANGAYYVQPCQLALGRTRCTLDGMHIDLSASGFAVSSVDSRCLSVQGNYWWSHYVDRIGPTGHGSYPGFLFQSFHYHDSGQCGDPGNSD